MPISDELRPVLERILAEIPDDPEAFLLDHAGAIRTAFENCVERAGLGKWRGRDEGAPKEMPSNKSRRRMAKGGLIFFESDVTPHVLRHTKATWMAQAGVSMFDIAGVLGDSVDTVTKTYAHHHPDYLRDAINTTGRKAA